MKIKRITPEIVTEKISIAGEEIPVSTATFFLGGEAIAQAVDPCFHCGSRTYWNTIWNEKEWTCAGCYPPPRCLIGKKENGEDILRWIGRKDEEKTDSFFLSAEAETNGARLYKELTKRRHKIKCQTCGGKAPCFCSWSSNHRVEECMKCQATQS